MSNQFRKIERNKLKKQLGSNKINNAWKRKNMTLSQMVKDTKNGKVK